MCTSSGALPHSSAPMFVNMFWLPFSKLAKANKSFFIVKTPTTPLGVRDHSKNAGHAGSTEGCSLEKANNVR